MAYPAHVRPAAGVVNQPAYGHIAEQEDGIPMDVYPANITHATPKNQDVPDNFMGQHSSDAPVRAIFISAKELMHDWRKVPMPVLENALFFFGSKRKWVFPYDQHERSEANRQPELFHRMPGELLQLIARKEQRGELHFLKRDDLAFKRWPGPPDPMAFQRASSWLEGLGYNPLRLNPQFWEFATKNAKFGISAAHARNIIDATQKGPPEYHCRSQKIAHTFENELANTHKHTHRFARARRDPGAAADLGI